MTDEQGDAEKNAQLACGMYRRNHLLWLLLAVLLASLVQSIAVFKLEHDPVDPYDSKEYLAIARSLYQGNGYGIAGEAFAGFESFQGESPTRMRQPGYPLYLFLTYWHLGQKIPTVQISQIMLNGLTLLLLFSISHLLFRNKLWPGTMIGLALYFPLWLTSASLLSESLFTFLLVFAMWLLLKAIHSSTRVIRTLALSGMAFGLAFLTRPIALPLILLTFVVISMRRKSLRCYAIEGGVLFGAFLLTVSPWWLRNGIALGDWVPLSTDGGYNIWYASVPEAEPKWWGSHEFEAAVGNGYYLTREANIRFTEMAIARITASPWAYLRRGVARVAWVWSYFPGSQLFRDKPLVFIPLTLVQLAIIVLAALGLVTTHRFARVYLLVPVFALTSVLLFTKGISRFILPAMPFVLLAAGQGFFWLWRQMARWRGQSR